MNLKVQFKMNLKSITLFILLFFLPIFTSVGKDLVACIDENPPYQYLSPSPYGINIERLKILAKTLNKRLKFFEAPNLARCLVMLKNGQVDVIAGLNKNSEREKFAFYAPYKIEEELVLISGIKFDVINYQSLQGKIIGVPRGTTYFEKFDKDKSLSKVPIQSVKIGVELLLKNRIDIILTTKPVATLLLNKSKYTQLKALAFDFPTLDKQSYFGFSKKNKLKLTKEEIVSKTTKAFNGGRFKAVYKMQSK